VSLISYRILFVGTVVLRLSILETVLGFLGKVLE
jgi:hypothetical protein